MAHPKQGGHSKFAYCGEKAPVRIGEKCTKLKNGHVRRLMHSVNQLMGGERERGGAGPTSH